jgi:predicted DNA-binding transcriptional regulator AlpA
VSETQTIEPLLLSAGQAAAICGVSRSLWWSMHSSGQIPLPVKLSGRTLWGRAELERWINARCPSREKWLLIKGNNNV